MKVDIYKILLGLGIIFVAGFYLFPYFWGVITSLKPEEEVFVLSLPTRPIFDRYVHVLLSPKFYPTLRNSIIVSLIATPFILAVASPAAFAITRVKELKGRTWIFMFFLLFMLLPPVAIVGYLYLLLGELKLFDSIIGLSLVYTAWLTPFAIWILSSYLRGVPKELEEAAIVDGASKFQLFLRVILPVALPGIIVTGIISFVNIWQEFLIAFSLTTTNAARTVTIGSLMFVGLYELKWSEVMTASIVATIPVAIVTFVAQKYIVRGLIAGIRG